MTYFQQFFYVNHNIIMWWKFSRFFKMFLKTFVQNISKIFENKHPINNHPRGWVWFMIFRLHPYVTIFFWVLNLTCKLSLTSLLHLVNRVLHFVIILNCLLVIDVIIGFGLCFVCFFKFLRLLYFIHYCNVELCSTMFIWTIVKLF